MTRRGERTSKRRPRGDGTRGPRSSGGCRLAAPCLTRFSYRAVHLDFTQMIDRCGGFDLGFFSINLVISMVAFWMVLWVKLGCMTAWCSSSEAGGPCDNFLRQ
eukprot:scaffold23963_cov73-Phaeocystis_antarctica.AAC.1